jgi:predicted RNA-binding Zn-ribbon protein involved in translation (DUF1610 family)
MAAKFNSGKPYHGSSLVSGGRLTGATSTDYFYFFCPKCGERTILRILEYCEHGPESKANFDIMATEYNSQTKGKKLKYGFALAFKLYCESCGLTDFVKISNVGFQGGQLPEE